MSNWSGVHDRHRPDRAGEGQVNRLPAQPEKAPRRHAGIGRPRIAEYRPPAERARLQGDARIKNGLPQQQPACSIERGENPEQRALGLPPDHATRRPEGKEREDLRRGDNDIGGGRETDADCPRCKARQQAAARPREQQRMAQRELEQQSRIGQPAKGAASVPKDLLIPKYIWKIIMPTPTANRPWQSSP